MPGAPSYTPVGVTFHLVSIITKTRRPHCFSGSSATGEELELRTSLFEQDLDGVNDRPSRVRFLS